MSVKSYIITAIRKVTMQISALSQKTDVGFSKLYVDN